MLNQIIVHPGRAHLDDFLAVCFLLNHFGNDVAVYRRDPTPEELEDPKTAVVDQGLQHVPALMNFDHHQFSPDHPPTCALSLVLQYLGLYQFAIESNWLAFTELADSKGPVEAAALVGCSVDKLGMTRSPLESAMLQIFGHVGPSLPVMDDFKNLMIQIAGQHLGRWRLSAERMAELPTMIDYHLDGKVAGLQVPAISKPTLALEKYFETTGASPVVVVSASERRVGSWSIYRRPGCEALVDLRNAPHCLFHHSNGFLAVTEKMDYTDALQIAINEVEKGRPDPEFEVKPPFDKPIINIDAPASFLSLIHI